MGSYEAMFILRPDLKETERNSIFDQLKETLTKFKANIQDAAIWQEKRKLNFVIGQKGQAVKFTEGLYYLMNFSLQPQDVSKLNSAFQLNENILRFLILAKGN